MTLTQAFDNEREQLTRALHALADSGLSPGSSGNASMRVEGGMLISPTGIAAADTRPGQLVFIDHQGECPEGQWRPSSEWHMHHSLYRNREDADAVVHCHSRYATALACQRRAIPPYHYMIAAAGGRDIRCAQYATFGTLALADAVEAALNDRRACLLANHGQIALGKDPLAALQLAREVEELAAGYHLTLATGGPVLLDDEQMDDVLRQFKGYGQQQ